MSTRSPYQVFDMCELTFNKVRHLHALPIAFDQQVLAGGKAVKPVGEARNKRRRVGLFCGLPRNGLHDREQVLGAMIDFSH